MRRDVRRGTARSPAAALGSCGPSLGRSASRRAAALRLARVVDVAETIFALITSRRFVTGQTIVIDGGYAATTSR